jgi:6-phosphogluconate dehydrogenase (decarboxylating)
MVAIHIKRMIFAAPGSFRRQVFATSTLAPVAACGGWMERGYCMMIGGAADVVARLDPIFAALAPGTGDTTKAVCGEFVIREGISFY